MLASAALCAESAVGRAESRARAASEPAQLSPRSFRQAAKLAMDHAMRMDLDAKVESAKEEEQNASSGPGSIGGDDSHTNDEDGEAEGSEKERDEESG